MLHFPISILRAPESKYHTSVIRHAFEPPWKTPSISYSVLKQAGFYEGFFPGRVFTLPPELP